MRLRSACKFIAIVFVAPVLRAQTLAPTPPAVCTAQATSTQSVRPVVADTGDITGVVVRFTANATGRPADAHLAKALSTITAERLQVLVEAPVRSRFDVTINRAPAATSSAVAEGRVLGVRWVVSGRVERQGDSVDVTWNALDSRTGVVRGAGKMRDKLVALDGLAGKLSTTIAGTIGVPATGPSQNALLPVARSIPAFESYLAGLFDFDSFDPASLRRAVNELRSAVQSDATLQPAWTALAESLARLVEWGEGGSARGRSQRSRDGLAAANRALALAPTNVRALVVLAHLHLMRDEPIAAAQVIDGIRNVAPSSDELTWLTAELALVRGDARAVVSVVDTSMQRIARNTRALYLRAEGDRRRGSMPAACQSLNRLLVLDPAWAPAYVQRALVRYALGDLRGGWQDAEMATRLGQPGWGNMVSALIDFTVGDSLRTRARMRATDRVSAGTVLPWLDALLQGAVWRATGQNDRALSVLAVTPCDDPRRRRLLADPLLRNLSININSCRASIGAPQPTGNLTQ